MDRISKFINYVKDKDFFPDAPSVNSKHNPKIVVEGKEVLLFASNNYLDMSSDERVIEAATVGLKKWGIGSGSARLLTGNLDINQQLEESIANFKERQAGLTFISGHAANDGALPALINVPDISLLSQLKAKFLDGTSDTIVFSDEFNHASIVSGISSSRAKKEIFKHRDMSDLKSKLAQHPKKVRKLIAVDGVFSMDGDIAPLPDILTLAKEYNAIVYLDDAHATGILGKDGIGTEDYFNVKGHADVIMGTFTKAFGGVGGFIVGTQYLVDYLKISARTFMFTAPIAPPIVCGLLESIKIVKEETWRREKVLENAKYLRDHLLAEGYDLCGSQTQIVPILIGDEKKAIDVSRRLLKEGIFIPAARWPAVPLGTARLRLTLMCTHTEDQIDHLLSTLKKIRAEFNF